MEENKNQTQEQQFAKDKLNDLELLEETKKLRTAKSTLYIKKKDRYEDLGSSAVIFIGFGFAGDLLALLSMLGIISFPLASTLYSQIVMLILFTIFLIVGITSWKKAKKLKTEIDTEEDVTTKINAWMIKHITKDTLDAIHDDEVSEEINVLNDLNYIKEITLEEFPDIEPDYIELLAEDHYNNICSE